MLKVIGLKRWIAAEWKRLFAQSIRLEKGMLREMGEQP
jgi:hypothetical protein